MKPFDHAGALGLLVLTVALLFLVHYDYQGLVRVAWQSLPAGGGRGSWVPGAAETDGVVCDWFDGQWVWDERYPLYESDGCPFLDDGFRCSENGRPDRMYTKWRWQPAGCDLPRSHSRFSFTTFCCSKTYDRLFVCFSFGLDKNNKKIFWNRSLLL